MICVLLFRPRSTPRIGMRRIRFPELPGRRCFFVSREPLLSSTAKQDEIYKERWVNSLLLLTLFETAVQEDISAGRLSPDESLPRQRCSRLSGKRILRVRLMEVVIGLRDREQSPSSSDSPQEHQWCAHYCRTYSDSPGRLYLQRRTKGADKHRGSKHPSCAVDSDRHARSRYTVSTG